MWLFVDDYQKKPQKACCLIPALRCHRNRLCAPIRALTSVRWASNKCAKWTDWIHCAAQPRKHSQKKHSDRCRMFDLPYLHLVRRPIRTSVNSVNMSIMYWANWAANDLRKLPTVMKCVDKSMLSANGHRKYSRYANWIKILNSNCIVSMAANMWFYLLINQ